jgi:FMN-dependent oxidoreductase (nitrilotriacetate monooxygenase family)
MGSKSQLTHDERYAAADEFMEVVYRLWEGSWEDDAVVADPESRIFTDPAKVHRVDFQGSYYSVDAIHLCEPSPQRTPVLFQAGSSDRGCEFAARHAECVFILQSSKTAAAKLVADLRARAVAQGRSADDLLIFNMITVITGPDEAAARAKLADYRRYISPESWLVAYSGGSGIDLSKHGLDDQLPHQQTEAVRSIMRPSVERHAGPTLRELAAHNGIGSGSALVVGSPTQVADELEAWVDETGINGFNLASVVMPETFTDFVDLVVPELQHRGRMKNAYTAGPLRAKLFGRSRLPTSHPASTFRTPSATS